MFASPRNAAAFLTLCSVFLNKKGRRPLDPCHLCKGGLNFCLVFICAAFYKPAFIKTISIALLSKLFSESLFDLLEEGLGIYLLLVLDRGKSSQVACHNALFNGSDSSLFQSISIVDKLGNVVQLASLAECACPCKQGCNGVCGGALRP